MYLKVPWSILKNWYRKLIRYDSILIRYDKIWFEVKVENLEMIPKKTIRFQYIFPHVLRKIGTISILSNYNHFILTNKQKQWNNFILIYRFLTDLTLISIINSNETDILYQRYIIPIPKIYNSHWKKTVWNRYIYQNRTVF